MTVPAPSVVSWPRSEPPSPEGVARAGTPLRSRRTPPTAPPPLPPDGARPRQMLSRRCEGSRTKDRGDEEGAPPTRHPSIRALSVSGRIEPDPQVLAPTPGPCGRRCGRADPAWPGRQPKRRLRPPSAILTGFPQTGRNRLQGPGAGGTREVQRPPGCVRETPIYSRFPRHTDVPRSSAAVSS
jgi:hypothetical protein